MEDRPTRQAPLSHSATHQAPAQPVAAEHPLQHTPDAAPSTESNTQQALDLLADLYLTAPVVPQDSQDSQDSLVSESSVAKPDEAKPDEAKPEPIMNLSENPVIGPAPIRLRPKIVAAAPLPPEAQNKMAVTPETEIDPEQSTENKTATNTATNTGTNTQTNIETQSEHGSQDDAVQRLRLRLSQVDFADDADADAADQASPENESAEAAASEPAFNLVSEHHESHHASDEVEPKETQEAMPTRQAFAEAVILGNLPGFAGPWLAQYAQLIADAHGSVAILNIEDDHIDLSVVLNREVDALSLTALNAEVDHDEPRTLTETLDALLNDELHPVRMIMLQLDSDATQPTQVERLNQLAYWTMLSGADDPAILHCFRTIKELVDAQDNIKTKQVGLMVMGSTGPTSLHAAKKLSKVSAALLDRPVEVLGHHQRMEPVNLHQLASFDLATNPWSDIAAYVDSLEDPVFDEPAVEEQTLEESAIKVEANKAEAETESISMPTQLETLTPEELSVLTEQASRFAEAEAEAEIEPSVSPEPATIESSSIATQPTQSTQPAQPAQPTQSMPDADSLSQQIISTHIPGGLILEARCPDHPAAELILDQQGNIHIAMRHDDQRSEQSSDLKPMLIDALAVAQWVQTYRDLLALTQRQCQFAEYMEPVIHLVTPRADRATDLIRARLADDLHLYLQAGDQLIPLN